MTQNITSMHCPLIFVGGPMTLDDGTKLDSRQAVTNDNESVLSLRAMQHSRLWWEIAFSTAKSTSEKDTPFAFTLIEGKRTLLDSIGGGKYKKPRLKTLLGKDTDNVEILFNKIDDEEGLPSKYEEIYIAYGGLNNAARYRLGLNRGDPEKKWKFIEGFIPDEAKAIVWKAISPHVLIKTSTDKYVISPDQNVNRNNFVEIDLLRAVTKSAVIFPHSFALNAFIGAYVNWKHDGSPSPEGPPPMEPSPWTRNVEAAPTVKQFVEAAVLESNYSITGIMQDDALDETSHGEEARQLIESRYELQVGFWDIVNNDVLRETLLSGSNVTIVPTEVSELPAEIQSRAEEKADELKNSLEYRQKIDDSLISDLVLISWEKKDLGWFRSTLAVDTSSLKQYGLGDNLLVALEFIITKRSCKLQIMRHPRIDNAPTFDDLKNQYGTEISKDTGYEFEGGTSMYSVLWKEKGGWGDDVDWPDRFRRLDAIIAGLLPLLSDFIQAYIRLSPLTKQVSIMAAARNAAQVEKLPPANWYPDPDNAAMYRYWDGAHWTEDRSPR